MKILIPAVVFLAMLLICSSVLVQKSQARDDAVFTDAVTSLTMHELYLSGLRFFIAPDVRIYLHTDGGRTVSLKSLVATGRIEKAQIFVTGSEVRKIVILDMRQ
jgi:hypothetical protein